MNHLERGLTKVNFAVTVLSVVGGVAIVCLFLIILADIVGRVVFNFSFPGSIEISEFILAGVYFVPLGYGLIAGRHVRVEALLSRFSPRMKTIVNIFVLLLSTGFFILLSWHVGDAAYTDWQTGAYHYGIMALPRWIPRFLAFIGCFLLVIALLSHILHNVVDLSKRSA